MIAFSRLLAGATELEVRPRDAQPESALVRQRAHATELGEGVAGEVVPLVREADQRVAHQAIDLEAGCVGRYVVEIGDRTRDVAELGLQDRSPTTRQHERALGLEQRRE